MKHPCWHWVYAARRGSGALARLGLSRDSTELDLDPIVVRAVYHMPEKFPKDLLLAERIQSITD